MKLKVLRVDPTTGQIVESEVEFIFCGRIDLVARLTKWARLVDQRGNIVTPRIVLDDKTATKKMAYNEDQWEPHNQFTGYIWAARELYGDPNIHHAFINQVYFTKKATEFNLHPTYRSNWDIAEWLAETPVLINNAQNAWVMWKRTNNVAYYPKNPTRCFDYFRACSYRPLCRIASPGMRDLIERGGYKTEEWRPWEWDKNDPRFSGAENEGGIEESGSLEGSSTRSES